MPRSRTTTTGRRRPGFNRRKREAIPLLLNFLQMDHDYRLDDLTRVGRRGLFQNPVYRRCRTMAEAKALRDLLLLLRDRYEADGQRWTDPNAREDAWDKLGLPRGPVPGVPSEL